MAANIEPCQFLDQVVTQSLADISSLNNMPDQPETTAAQPEKATKGKRKAKEPKEPKPKKKRMTKAEKKQMEEAAAAMAAAEEAAAANAAKIITTMTTQPTPTFTGSTVAPSTATTPYETANNLGGPNETPKIDPLLCKVMPNLWLGMTWYLTSFFRQNVKGETTVLFQIADFTPMATRIQKIVMTKNNLIHLINIASQFACKAREATLENAGNDRLDYSMGPNETQSGSYNEKPDELHLTYCEQFGFGLRDVYWNKYKAMFCPSRRGATIPNEIMLNLGELQQNDIDNMFPLTSQDLLSQAITSIV